MWEGNGKEQIIMSVWEGNGKEIMRLVGMGGKWEGNYDIFGIARK